MSKEQLRKKYVRTTHAIRQKLKQLAADLAATERFASRGHAPDEEDIVSASWLWMRDFDVEELAETLEPYLAKVEPVVARLLAEAKAKREAEHQPPPSNITLPPKDAPTGTSGGHPKPPAPPRKKAGR